MLDYLWQYGLFLAETLTVAAAVAALILLVAVLAARRRAGGGPERLEVRDLGARYHEMKRTLESGLLRGKARKAAAKDRKREAKAREKGAGADRPRVFVLDFKGDIRASAVSSLREEVTAVLAHARPEDEVLVRLESAGGLVHEYGLAASQLMRVRERGIPLTVSVDRIAASGGYMMACVADRILAAPFAILGSIGVLAQIPNFHRLLDRHGIDFEQFKGGEFKRTVTMFGENTDADRAKLTQDIGEIHGIFKHFVAEQRPGLDVERVATGEHWLGRRAKDLGLCDELVTSDDYLLAATERAELVGVRFEARKRLASRLAESVSAFLGGAETALRTSEKDRRLSL
ncbi:MAG: protease SohB [Thiotrichales bacterium]|nr:protease SohB [Thiotrichales bacterium]MCY4350010.1 protease SohB [Thiotrichales bacterium]